MLKPYEVRDAVEALALLADWLTQIQNESDHTDAELSLLKLNGDSVAWLSNRLRTELL